MNALLRSAETELRRVHFAFSIGHAIDVAKYGQGWIRTSEGVKPADLQNDTVPLYKPLPVDECQSCVKICDLWHVLNIPGPSCGGAKPKPPEPPWLTAV
jgi:hypothetical protein